MFQITIEQVIKALQYQQLHGQAIMWLTAQQAESILSDSYPMEAVRELLLNGCKGYANMDINSMAIELKGFCELYEQTPEELLLGMGLVFVYRGDQPPTKG